MSAGTLSTRVTPGSALFAVLLVSCHLYFANEFRPFPNPNVQSRVYLALAVADGGTIKIDGQVKLYGPSQDMAEAGGHLYSDKAPAYSVALAALASGLRTAGVPIEDYRTMAVLLRVLGLTLPAICFWFWVSARWTSMVGDAARTRAVVVAGALGTSFFVYATQLFAHAAAGMLLYIAYVSLSSRRKRAEVVAGLLLSVAFTTDYIALPAVVVLAAGAMVGSGNPWRRLLLLAIGAAPVLGAWMSYNAAAFGNPLDVGFHHHVDPVFGPAYRSGLWGVQPLDPPALLGMTILPSRGLVWMSPVLILAPFGWWRAWTEGRRKEAVLCFAVTVATALFAATTVQWRGGWAVGPRYLVPALPFLLQGIVAALAAGPRTRFAFQTLSLVGLVNTSLAASTFPGFPNAFENPFHDLAWPLLRTGHVNGTLWNSAATWGEALPYFGLMCLAGVCVVVWAAERGSRLRSYLAQAPLAALIVAAQSVAATEPTFAKHLTTADVLDRMGYTCDADSLRIATLEAGVGKPQATDPAQLALVRATTPCADLRSPDQAMRWAQEAVRITEGRDPRAWDSLGAALAASGDYEEARKAAELALTLMPPDAPAAAMRQRLAHYAQGKSYLAPMRYR